MRLLLSLLFSLVLGVSVHGASGSDTPPTKITSSNSTVTVVFDQPNHLYDLSVLGGGGATNGIQQLNGFGTNTTFNGATVHNGARADTNYVGELNVTNSTYLNGSNVFTYTQGDTLATRPVMQSMYGSATLTSNAVAGSDFHLVDVKWDLFGTFTNANAYGFESKVQNWSGSAGKLVGGLFEANQTAAGLTALGVGVRILNQATASGAIFQAIRGIELNCPSVYGGAYVTNFNAIDINVPTGVDNSNVVESWNSIQINPPVSHAGGLVQTYRALNIITGGGATNVNTGVYIDAITGASTANYGLYVKTPTGGAANYSIYSFGANRFEGATQMGVNSGTPLQIFGGNNAMSIQTPANTAGKALQIVDGTRTMFIGASSSLGGVWGTAGAHPLALELNSTPVMTVDVNSNFNFYGSVKNDGNFTNTADMVVQGVSVFGSGSGIPITVNGGDFPVSVNTTPNLTGHTIQFQDGTRGGYAGVSSVGDVEFGSYTAHPVSIRLDGTRVINIDTSTNVTIYGPTFAPQIATTNITSGTSTSTNGYNVPTLGQGITIKAGANGKLSSTDETLSAGTVVINNTSITANSKVFLQPTTISPVSGVLAVTAKSVGASFTVTSSNNLDTNQFSWFIVEAQ